MNVINLTKKDKKIAYRYLKHEKNMQKNYKNNYKPNWIERKVIAHRKNKAKKWYQNNLIENSNSLGTTAHLTSKKINRI